VVSMQELCRELDLRPSEVERAGALACLTFNYSRSTGHWIDRRQLRWWKAAATAYKRLVTYGR
jgi:hypothetical protein